MQVLEKQINPVQKIWFSRPDVRFKYLPPNSRGPFPGTWVYSLAKWMRSANCETFFFDAFFGGLELLGTIRMDHKRCIHFTAKVCKNSPWLSIHIYKYIFLYYSHSRSKCAFAGLSSMNFVQSMLCIRWWVVPPPRMPVTTRIMTCFVGNFYKFFIWHC